MDQQPQLVMLNPSLSELPPLQLAQGYSIRTFQPGDEAAWESIIGEAFGGAYLFEHMTKDDPYAPERVFFVCSDDQPVATASAWWRPQWGEFTGYLHMVGVLPSQAGKRLGYTASLAAMHRMAEENRSRAILNTDDFRIPAIKIYLNLGYEPVVDHPSHYDRWKLILTQLNEQERLSRLQPYSK
ncbi:GNAT family N-acetyltransferase [Paenibacillus mendelii]|uniref:GNAT family N-acetyltransferase n=1 Tax=Paenibacillus mendelii TaxID=206163 RepID=A0ABV6J746_9BACL|nr:GNAT family N-acetyltransferase [Paenibacillus mendelii]MCQ6564036.1 GNAT family N-acetyltransferase [Paenibacillus mendelii]